MTADIQEVALHETAQERYLNYAMSVITSRALPDVRDGLKPVQRRILYAMFNNLRLYHDQKHKKSAAVVGEVMARFHPHGDQSIYDAMVRMAQDFSMRYPLVDGQGNFGSMDGDGAAAMRYTEARLAQLAGELLEEIRKRTVEFRPNYDGTVFEPIVLPAQVPNLLINGATGIAVGMATNIPPHNLGEVVDALVALIKDPELTVRDIVGTYIKGPDFPTGGILLEDPEELIEMYETGSGSVTLRSSWEIEEEDGKRQVVVTAVPYTVNRAQLVGKIAQHIEANKLPQALDVRDESTDDVRIVIELRKGSAIEPLMAYLFKHTPMENRFHTNLTCLIPNPDNPQVPTPAKVSLRDVLRHFLDFRMEVLVRRLQYDLEQLRRRIHILEGFELLFDDLDEALRLIRASAGKRDAADKLIERFGLDDDQAMAILELQLYRLARLEIDSIKSELAEKRGQAGEIEKLLDSERRRWTVIKNELLDVKKRYDDGRRSKVDAKVREFEYSEEAYIVDEDYYVIATRKSFIKRQKSYSKIESIRARDNDQVGWVLPGSTRSTVLFFTNRGRCYTMRIDDVPATTGYGDPLQSIFNFDDGEQVVGMITTDDRVLDPYRYEQLPPDCRERVRDNDESAPQFVTVTRGGQSLRFSSDGFEEPSTRNGRMFINLDDGDEVVNVEPCRGDELLVLASREGRGLIFEAHEVSYYKGAAKGVKAIDLEGKDDVLDFTLTLDEYRGLEVETNRGATQEIRASLAKFVPTSRGNKGRWVIKRGHLVRSHRAAVEVRRPEDEEEE